LKATENTAVKTEINLVLNCESRIANYDQQNETPFANNGYMNQRITITNSLMNFNIRTYTFILSLLLVITFASCNKKDADTSKKNTEESDEKDWKEMDEFHMVMAETFHPYKDSANLEPAKAKAGDLVASADKWTSAGLPGKVDNDQMKTKLQQLKSEAEALQDIVQTGKDEEIGAQLTQLHDTFHQIQELWYGSQHGHEEHEHAH
jgi:hypothetical protein